MTSRPATAASRPCKGISLTVDRGRNRRPDRRQRRRQDRTTLMSICGIAPPRSGRDPLQRPADPDKPSPDKIVALGISQVPEGRRIFPQMTRPGKPGNGRLPA
ncbi:MAG: hypothetical protein MZU95_07545 [Desulfomicrobium escambiense]|nr:hypothetical protein [Desulfomicrobium escambiense]